MHSYFSEIFFALWHTPQLATPASTWCQIPITFTTWDCHGELPLFFCSPSFPSDLFLELPNLLPPNVSTSCLLFPSEILRLCQISAFWNPWITNKWSFAPIRNLVKDWSIFFAHWRLFKIFHLLERCMIIRGLCSSKLSILYICTWKLLGWMSLFTKWTRHRLHTKWSIALRSKRQFRASTLTIDRPDTLTFPPWSVDENRQWSRRIYCEFI